MRTHTHVHTHTHTHTHMHAHAHAHTLKAADKLSNFIKHPLADPPWLAERYATAWGEEEVAVALRRVMMTMSGKWTTWARACRLWLDGVRS